MTTADSKVERFFLVARGYCDAVRTWHRSWRESGNVPAHFKLGAIVCTLIIREARIQAVEACRAGQEPIPDDVRMLRIQAELEGADALALELLEALNRAEAK